MDKDEFLMSGLIEKYVLDLASPNECAEVERYAAAFPEIKAEIEALRSAMQHYAAQQTNELLQAGPPAKAALHYARRRWQGIAVAGAAMSILLGISLLYWRSAFLNLSAAHTTLQAHCTHLQQQHEHAARVYALTQDTHTEIVHLHGTPLAPDAHAVVYWNDNKSHAYLQFVNMPPPPPGHQYQIWADVDGVMIDAGLLQYNFLEPQLVRIIAEAESLNITLEPQGGSAHPTVANLMLNGRMIG